MKMKYAKAATAVIIVFAVFSTVPVCLAEDYAVSYQLLDELDGTVTYKLNVVIPQSLLDYYSRKSHRSASDSDFTKFVTPYALKPVADCLSELYADEEDFANGALMIVHQIPYEEINSSCMVLSIIFCAYLSSLRKALLNSAVLQH
jgi:hypothetical protein